MLERIIEHLRHSCKYKMTFDYVFGIFDYQYILPLKKWHIERTLDKYAVYLEVKYQTPEKIYEALELIKHIVWDMTRTGLGERRGYHGQYFMIFRWRRFQKALKKAVGKPKPQIKVNKRKFLKLLTADGASSQRPGERF